MVGTDRYGTAAPTGINAHQTTIAVADVTHIAVGDYLSVGDEMMYVKSVDGNYIGALVSCPHALCTILHPSLSQGLMGLAKLLAPRVISCTVAVGGIVCANVLHACMLTRQHVHAIAGVERGVAGSKALAHAASSDERAWVTVYKRDTSVNSYYLTADKSAAATSLQLNAVASDICVNTEGCLLLVGGTTEKEFMSAPFAPTTNVLTVATAVLEATNRKPYVTTLAYAHQVGDSVVQYTCDWKTPAAQMSAATTSLLAQNTQGGINARKGYCVQTSLVGLTVIPVKSSIDISPGDFIRIEFPKAMVAGVPVASITVTAGGSGYKCPPTIAITGGGGSGATAIAVLTNDTVSSITITNAGSGYSCVPRVIITPVNDTTCNASNASIASGTGATATANTLSALDNSEEEIYRVNSVDGSDLIVTPKPLATPGSTERIPVNHYQGGSTLDVLQYRGTITFVGVINNNATNQHNVSTSSTMALSTNDYCLIDREFFKIEINPLISNRLIFPAQGNGNVGRASFGTTAADHISGTCDIYRINKATQQAVPGTREWIAFWA